MFLSSLSPFSLLLPQTWSSDVKAKDSALKSGLLTLSKSPVAPIRGPSASILLPSSIDQDTLRFNEAKQAGNDAFTAGRYKEALEKYTQAMLLAPTNPVGACNRAAALLKLGRYHEAEADCTSAIELDKRMVKAWYRRANARKEMRKFQEALKDLQEINMKLDKNNKPAQTMQKEVEILLIKQQEARAAVR